MVSVSSHWIFQACQQACGAGIHLNPICQTLGGTLKPCFAYSTVRKTVKILRISFDRQTLSFAINLNIDVRYMKDKFHKLILNL